MEPRDRRVSLALVGLAAGAWLVVGLVLLTLDPQADPLIRYGGAGLIGLAVGLTAVPLFWLYRFARQRRIAFRGDWSVAARRGAWVGGVVAVIVLLRLEGLFQPQVGLFLAALAVIAELTLSSRR
jgi:hypothetical protein